MSFNKAKILFVYQVPLTFIEKDLEILKSAYEVRELRFRGLRDILSLFRGVLWCDATFSWFGSINAFFAVLFSNVLGKKSIVVAGGHEVVHEPEIKYGMFSFWWKKWCPLYVFGHVDLVLSVSESTTQECIQNAKAHKGRIKLLYHGFDSEMYKHVEKIKKEPIVITIGRVKADTLKKKGLEVFVQSASFLPETKFFLVGPWDDVTVNYLKETASPNVTLTGGLYGKDLVELCSRAKVYVQASYHESFGCSIAEAMLCECIAVVSRKAAIPEVVGDCGIYLDKLTAKDVAEKIKEALHAPGDLGKMARERIVNLFPLRKRKEDLIRAVDSLLEIR
jgi:glycosyltransferase involved in cell wall biosynthesis